MKGKFSRAKSSHLFQNLFLIQLLLLVCMLAYLTFFMDRYVFQAQVRELDRSNLQVLEQASNSIDHELGDLQQQVRMFLSDQTVMGYLFGDPQSGIEESMEILKTLKHYVDLTPGVEQLWLYAPYPGTVLSSDGYLTARSGSRISMVLDRYEEQSHPRSAPDYALAAVTLDGQLYILIDFVPNGQIGCFIFRMDAQRFGAEAEGGKQPILAVDSDGALVLDEGKLAYGTQYFSLSNQKLFYTASSSARTDGQQYYRVENEKLNWSLLMPVSSVTALYKNPAVWALLLPALVALFLLGAVGAWFITMKIYAPINRLLTLVMEQSGTGVPQGKDIDYLEAAYQQTLQDNQNLRTRFSLLGQDVSQYLCRKAVDGQLTPADEADSIGSLIPDGLFQVALIRLGESRMEFQSSIKHKLQLSALENLAKQLPECLCCLEREQDTIALVFHLPPQSEPGHIRRVLEDFVAQAVEQTQCELLCGLGGSCSMLSQLNESMGQAIRDLQYNTYIAADPDSASARAAHSKAVEEHISQVINRAIFAQDDLDSYVEQITQLAEQDAKDGAERLRGYEMAQDLLLERLLFQEEAVQALPVFHPDQTGQQDREEFMSFCRRALELGRSMAGRKKFRYVDEAKKYIQENYMNCSLSANDISDHIGISPSYFSSLFNELLQESVVSYLNRVRVEHAKIMLTMTGIPVKEVGFRCGFNSANVFGRVFKKYTDLSPKQYRDDTAAQQKEVPHD